MDWYQENNIQKIAVSTIHTTWISAILMPFIPLLHSVQSQQSDLKASIAVPQAPFTIGVDAEHSRSVSIAFSRIKAGGTFGKASDLKRIGRIINDLVERGSYDEAVVGVSIQPISNLVRLRYLQLTLKKALLEYIETQGDSTCEKDYSSM